MLEYLELEALPPQLRDHSGFQQPFSSQRSQREVVKKNGLLVPVTPITPKASDEASEILSVRFRTVGDISCTCPVLSEANTPEKIIAETVLSEITERGATRMDDQTSEASMERRKKEGYF